MHSKNDAEHLKEFFVDSAVASVFKGTEAESRGLSYQGILTRQVLSQSGRGRLW